MTNKIYIPLILGFCLSIAACTQRSVDDHDIVLAEVDGQLLLLDDIKKSVSDERYQRDSLSVIEQYRNRWIKNQLKITEARRLGLGNQDEVQRRIRKAEETILVDAYNEAVYLDQEPGQITRSEAQTYYENNKDKFVLTEPHVRFRHIEAATLSDAQNAVNALHQAQSWRSITERYSVNPRQAYRNSAKYFPESSALAEFESMNNFLQVIGVTEISPIRNIGGHYHFVQLLERRETGEHPDMEWIIDQITRWLEIDHKRKHLRSMEQNLFLEAQANNEITIYDIITPEQEIEIETDNL